MRAVPFDSGKTIQGAGTLATRKSGEKERKSAKKTRKSTNADGADHERARPSGEKQEYYRDPLLPKKYDAKLPGPIDAYKLTRSTGSDAQKDKKKRPGIVDTLFKAWSKQKVGKHREAEKHKKVGKHQKPGKE